MQLAMRERTILLAFATTMSISGSGAIAAPDVKPKESLAWRDVEGRAHSLNEASKSKATVFIFTSTQCPISNIYTPRLIELGKTYGPRAVQFYAVNSNREDTREAVAKFAKERGFPFPTVKDNGTTLADKLDAHYTPEAVVIDSAGAVRYRGRIDDNKEREKVVRQDLREALDALLEGKDPPRASTIPVGCTIFRDKAIQPIAGAATVTFARDVAPILNANCVACHRSGEVAPFSLETYQQAKTWASQIRDYTVRKLMPPWKAVPGYGSFHDSRSLTPDQINTLGRWADSGAPAGDLKAAPVTPQFGDPAAWYLGKPDQVIQPVRDYHLDAEGKDVYRNFVLPAEFSEDRYLSAMEFKPGNRAIVHHVVLYIDTMRKADELDNKEKEPGYTVPGVGIGVEPAIWGEVWVPGNAPRMLPQGVAIRIPKGSHMVMQVHYHKSGKPEVDRTQVALFFAKDKVEKVIHTTLTGQAFFVLKPGEKSTVVTSNLVVPFDMTLRSIFPHMHMLGKLMKVTATLPDGTTRKLIRIDDWDFNWQATYHYKEPVKLPKGTKIDVYAVYDNSESNPRQHTHPPKQVTWGEQTTDEMMFCFFNITADQENVAAGKLLKGVRGDRSGI